MYRNKFIIVLCVVAIVKANDDFRLIDSIRQEPSCLSRGGLCTIAKDCPEGQLVEERGLCIEQKKRGVECCFGISVKETRCEKRGGVCMPGRHACAEIIAYRNATDCPKDSTCCILVQ